MECILSWIFLIVGVWDGDINCCIVSGLFAIATNVRSITLKK